MYIRGRGNESLLFLFQLVKDEMNELINLPQIKGLKHADENAVRAVTHQITEMLKGIVSQHIKDNYKVIIQVITYPKQNEEQTFIMSQCLWNYRTDDVLSLEIESDVFRFFIVIHGLVAWLMFEKRRNLTWMLMRILWIVSKICSLESYSDIFPTD